MGESDGKCPLSSGSGTECREGAVPYDSVSEDDGTGVRVPTRAVYGC